MRAALSPNTRCLLRELPVDLATFREAFDRLLRPVPARPAEWFQSLRVTRLATAKLYLDYLLVASEERTLWRAAVDRRLRSIDRRRQRRGGVARREIHEGLKSAPLPDVPNKLAGAAGLRSRRDFAAAITINLPDIYEGSFKVEAAAVTFLETQDSQALADMTVGLQHIGRNHAVLVLAALEWALPPEED